MIKEIDLSGSVSGGIGHTDWKDYADERRLTEDEILIQNTLQVVLINPDVRISEFKYDMVSFYYSTDDGLQVKEISLTDMVRKLCRTWADIREVMCFIVWDQPPLNIFMRIVKVSEYKNYGDYFAEGEKYKSRTENGKHITESIVPEWGVMNFDAIKYLINKQSSRIQKNLNKI